MNEQTEKLKPCPFCGEVDDLHPGMHFVRCGNCGATAGSDCKGESRNIKYWNTRAAIDSAPSPDAIAAARAEAYRECAAIVANTPLNGDRVGIVTAIYDKIKAKIEGGA